MMRFEITRGEELQRDTIAPVLNSLTDTTALSVGEVSLDTSGCKATTICTDNALGQSHTALCCSAPEVLSTDPNQVLHNAAGCLPRVQLYGTWFMPVSWPDYYGNSREYKDNELLTQPLGHVQE